MSSFEDEFGELQFEMVRAALDLVSAQVDDVFVYVSCEDDGDSFNVFYGRNGRIAQLGQLKSLGLPGGAPSEELELQLLDLGIEDVERLAELCDRYDRDTPTQINIHYRVSAGDLESDITYDPVLTDESGLTARNVLDAWIAKVAQAYAL